MNDSVAGSLLDRDTTELDAAALPAAVAALPPGVRVVRIGNPLRAPLTLQRLLIQAGQFDLGADLAEALAAVTARRGAEPAVLMVIEQAETLDGAVLPALAAAAEAQRFTGPTLHVALVRSAPPAGDDAAPSAPPPALPALVEPPSAQPVETAVEAPAAPPSMAVALQRPSAASGSLQAVAVEHDRSMGRQQGRRQRKARRTWPLAILAIVAVVLVAAAASFRRAWLPLLPGL